MSDAAPAASGGLSELKELAAPEAGAYLLSFDVPRRDGEPLRGAAGALFSAWEAALHVLPPSAGPPTDDLWRGATRRAPAERRPLGSLALASDMAGPSGTVRRTNSDGGFALVASTTIQLPPGPYRLSAASDDGVRLWLDDRLVIDNWTTHAAVIDEATIHLADRPHRLRVEYFQGSGAFALWLRVEPSYPPPSTMPATTRGTDVGAVQRP
jgi:hypothetical protein